MQRQSTKAVANRRAPTRLSKTWKRVRDHTWHYVFLTPMLILFFAFTLWPMLASWYYGFFSWDGYGPPTLYIGLGNFRDAFFDTYFWNAFKNSFYFALAAVFIEVPVALVFASLLNNPKLRGKSFYRVLLFLPVVTTTAVVGIVFAILLDPAGGPVNETLLNWGLVNRPINFLGSETSALPTVITVTLWKSLGVTLIYWLAGLQAIPSELYEAARIDGASAIQSFFRITIPLLVPIGVIIVLLTFIQSLRPFDIVQTMTAGGPNRATDVIETYIYRYAFNPDVGLPRYGFASAAALIFGLAVLAITVLQAVLLRVVRREGTRP